jgi:predicted secreted protein
MRASSSAPTTTAKGLPACSKSPAPSLIEHWRQGNDKAPMSMNQKANHHGPHRTARKFRMCGLPNAVSQRTTESGSVQQSDDINLRFGIPNGVKPMPITIESVIKIPTERQVRESAAEIADVVLLFEQRGRPIISLILLAIGWILMPYTLSHSKWYTLSFPAIVSAATSNLNERPADTLERAGRGKKMHQFSENDNGREIEIPMGESIEVNLRDNPTTGFKWRFKSNGEPICTLATEFFSGQGISPGQGGTRHWQFKIVTPGTATIELLYTRSWQPEAPPARRYILKVRAGG